MELQDIYLKWTPPFSCITRLILTENHTGYLRSPVWVASDILTPSYKLLFIKEPVDISILKVYDHLGYEKQDFTHCGGLNTLMYKQVSLRPRVRGANFSVHMIFGFVLSPSINNDRFLIK